MPVPVNLYPGLPHNDIEHHEVQRAWRSQLLCPQPPNPPEPVVQPDPQVQPPPVDHPWHGAIHYEGVARPQIGPQRDYNAELQRNFEQRHAQRRRRRAGRQGNDLPAAAPDEDDQQVQFNAQIHQHMINFQHEAEQALQEQQQNQALQVPRANLQIDLIAQQQLQNERAQAQIREAHHNFMLQQWQQQALVNQQQEHREMELAHHQREAEVEHRVWELELQHQHQEIEVQRVVEQRREQEQEEHLNDLYQEYGPALAEHREEDMARNKDGVPPPGNLDDPNDPLPHNNNAPLPNIPQ